MTKVEAVFGHQLRLIDAVAFTKGKTHPIDNESELELLGIFLFPSSSPPSYRGGRRNEAMELVRMS